MSILKTMGLAVAIVALVAASLALPAVRAEGNGEGGASWQTELSGAQEVPPRATPATGEASFELSADGASIHYEIEVEDISNVIMAHIHMGAVGINGPIVVWLFPVGGPPPAAPGGGPFEGVLATGTITASSLVGPLAGHTLGDLVALLNIGNAYVNVHTKDSLAGMNKGPGDFPGGEIRGQVRVEDD